MWGPCACPRPGLRHLVGSEQHPTEVDQDRHKAPTLPHVRPLSLQGGASVFSHFPIRLPKLIRAGLAPALTKSDLSS